MEVNGDFITFILAEIEEGARGEVGWFKGSVDHVVRHEFLSPTQQSQDRASFKLCSPCTMKRWFNKSSGLARGSTLEIWVDAQLRNVLRTTPAVS